MPRERGGAVGRAVELAALDEFVGTPALLVVRGDAGIGKTTLLGEVHRSWQERGITVVALTSTEASPRWDLFGAGSVMDLLRNSFDELGDARIGDAMCAVSRLCHPDSYAVPRTRAALFTELVRLFSRLRADGALAFLIDDVHTAPDPALAVAAAQRAGCTVVATCREDGITSEPTALSAVADRVVDLGPLPAADIDELLTHSAKGPLDEAVAPAVRAALGSLAGNPEAALAVLELLRAEGRFTEVMGHLCLRDAEPASIALPADHELVRHVDEVGGIGRQLVAVVAGADRFGLDDVLVFARATGLDVATCGAAVDRLVTVGALDCDDDGVLNVPCPALATTVLGALGDDAARAVHRAIADHLRESGADSTAFADHVALAREAVPNDPSLVAVLEASANRVLRANPVLAARWYRTAVRHSAPRSSARGRLVWNLVHLLVRLAQYRCLGEVVDEVVADGVEESCRYELAAAAALAAVHTGRPVPRPIYDALARDFASRAPLEFAARWFAGREPVRATEVAAAFTAFRADHLFDQEPVRGEAIEIADDQYDVATMFKLVLGGGYGEPATGPLAVYGRLVRDYVNGDWAGLPSDARRLELTGPPHTAIHHMSRLLAAEVLSSFGDFERATEWLEMSGDDCPFPAMRTWVDIGIVYRSSDWDLAIECGWADYEEISRAADQGNSVGLRWYLVRLAFLEERVEHAEPLARLCEETRRWHARFGGAGLHAAELILRGLSEHDYPAATAAVDLLRKQGNLAELMRACMTVAFFCDDPGPWYREALEISKRLGEGWMGAHIKQSMRKVGVTPPRARACQDDFSDAERQIIALVQRGMTNRQIAATVQASEKTVENQLTRLFAKTGCRSRLDLATASLEGRLAVATPDNSR